VQGDVEVTTREADRRGVPLVGGDGTIYGRLLLPADGTGGIPALGVTVAQMIGARLERQARDRRHWDVRLREIRCVLDERTMRIVYQPIVDLTSGRTVGAEALARFASEIDLPPDRWFSDATALGLGHALELDAIAAALQGLSVLPPEVYLSVNVSPAVARSPDLRALLRAHPLDRVVFEITEHAEIVEYAALNRALQPLRRGGLRLAVDDAGAGFASLRHILQMSPDIIKLDRSMVSGVDRKPVLRALSYSIAAFASATDATVIAEGIESQGELDAMRFLGVGYGQGYFLSRPVSAAAIAAGDVVMLEDADTAPR
jgi:EAL domain-containing protein (putative c-di-GMP-specific phosphodiesterase class I)